MSFVLFGGWLFLQYEASDRESDAKFAASGAGKQVAWRNKREASKEWSAVQMARMPVVNQDAVGQDDNQQVHTKISSCHECELACVTLH